MAIKKVEILIAFTTNRESVKRMRIVSFSIYKPHNVRMHEKIDRQMYGETTDKKKNSFFKVGSEFEDELQTTSDTAM